MNTYIVGMRIRYCTSAYSISGALHAAKNVQVAASAATPLRRLLYTACILDVGGADFYYRMLVHDGDV